MQHAPPTRPMLRGSFGMVSSTHWLASASGMRVLERGGNAFDAAVAAGFALQVVEPHFNGLGGEAPILLHDAGADRTVVIDGQGPVPSALTRGAVMSLGLDRVPGTGPMSATVPGAFDAWITLAEEFGRLHPEDLLAPAISLAQEGIPVVRELRGTLTSLEETFRTHWPSSAETFLTDGIPEVGGRFRNPRLAATYRRLLAVGRRGGGGRVAQLQAMREAFYRGFVAEAVDALPDSTDVDGNPSPVLLTGEDLADFRVRLEEPVTYDYGGVRVAKPGPWSQGPVFLQQLALLEAAGLDRYEPDDPEVLHLVLEAGKLAFADREAWYGDPDGFDVPLAALLSRSYARERAALIGSEASLEMLPGAPDGRPPRMPTPLAHLDARMGSASAAFGEPTVRERLHGHDTCHVDVVDREGNLVSAMPSGGWLQSSPAVGNLGFALGTRAQMTWLEPGLASSLTPGRRPRTTLSPTLLDDGLGGRLAFGTPGGDRQDQWALQFLLAWLHSDRDLQQAAEVPTFQTSHLHTSFFPRAASPGLAHVEGRIAESAVAELRRRGHDVRVEGDWSLGRVTAAGVERGTGWLTAASNPRGLQSWATGR